MPRIFSTSLVSLCSHQPSSITSSPPPSCSHHTRADSHLSPCVLTPSSPASLRKTFMLPFDNGIHLLDTIVENEKRRGHKLVRLASLHCRLVNLSRSLSGRAEQISTSSGFPLHTASSSTTWLGDDHHTTHFGRRKGFSRKHDFVNSNSLSTTTSEVTPPRTLFGGKNRVGSSHRVVPPLPTFRDRSCTSSLGGRLVGKTIITLPHSFRTNRYMGDALSRPTAYFIPVSRSILSIGSYIHFSSQLPHEYILFFGTADDPHHHHSSDGDEFHISSSLPALHLLAIYAPPNNTVKSCDKHNHHYSLPRNTTASSAAAAAAAAGAAAVAPAVALAFGVHSLPPNMGQLTAPGSVNPAFPPAAAAAAEIAGVSSPSSLPCSLMSSSNVRMHATGSYDHHTDNTSSVIPPPFPPLNETIKGYVKSATIYVEIGCFDPHTLLPLPTRPTSPLYFVQRSNYRCEYLFRRSVLLSLQQGPLRYLHVSRPLAYNLCSTSFSMLAVYPLRHGDLSQLLYAPNGRPFLEELRAHPRRALGLLAALCTTVAKLHAQRLSTRLLAEPRQTSGTGSRTSVGTTSPKGLGGRMTPRDVSETGGLVHTDIKLENFLFYPEKCACEIGCMECEGTGYYCRVELTDFDGLVNEGMKLQGNSTPGYVSPQLQRAYETRNWNYRSRQSDDCFALGHVLRRLTERLFSSTPPIVLHVIGSLTTPRDRDRITAIQAWGALWSLLQLIVAPFGINGISPISEDRREVVVESDVALATDESDSDGRSNVLEVYGKEPSYSNTNAASRANASITESFCSQLKSDERGEQEISNEWLPSFPTSPAGIGSPAVSSFFPTAFATPLSPLSSNQSPAMLCLRSEPSPTHRTIVVGLPEPAPTLTEDGSTTTATSIDTQRLRKEVKGSRWTRRPWQLTGLLT